MELCLRLRCFLLFHPVNTFQLIYRIRIDVLKCKYVFFVDIFHIFS